MRRLIDSVWQPMAATFERFHRDDGELLAAAVAYYAALSFFPLLLVLISGLGLFLQFTDIGRTAEQQVLGTIAEYSSPSVKQDIAEILESVQSKAPISGPVGLLTLILAALVLFAQFDRAFDRIWNVESPKKRGILATLKYILFHRLRAFCMLLGLGTLVVISFLAGLTLSAIENYTSGALPWAAGVWLLISAGTSIVINIFAFTVIYKVLPKVPVRWSEGFRGGMIAAVVWEVGRQILAAFLIGDKFSAYGIVGSFLAVMLWTYYAATVLFLGAEYIQVVCARCNPIERRA